MQTILISGAGTGVGKTHVTAALARTAAQAGRTVQIVKPVQTGSSSGDPSDAEAAAALAQLAPWCAHTLRQFPAPLAPLAAASAAGARLDWRTIITDLQALPSADLRLIEGAGGLAVPLGPAGWDWADFAAELRVDAVVLVVRAELGAINQSRLVYHYLASKPIAALRGGVFLNAILPEPPDVRQSTREALRASAVPLWGELQPESLAPTLYAPLADWFSP